MKCEKKCILFGLSRWSKQVYHFGGGLGSLAEDCTGLEVLDCSDCRLEELRLSGCVSLNVLDCHNNSLHMLDAYTFRRGEVLQNLEDKPAVRDMYLKAWERIKAGK